MNTTLVIEADATPDANFHVTIPLKNTQYLYPLEKVTIDGRKAKTISVKWNEEAVLLFDDEGGITAGTYTIENPHYTWGTILSLNNELRQIRYDDDKYPLIYLFQRHSYTKDRSPSAADKVESDVRLFFLSNYDINDYTRDDHHLLVRAMINMQETFIQTLERNPKIGELGISRNEDYVEFGTYKPDKGSEKNLVGDNLTGVELRIKIPFFACC